MTVIYRISHGAAPAHHARGAHSCPALINDEMPPTKNMVDGQIYTSKAAMRATYRPSGNAEGASFAEVGNDPAMFRRTPKSRPDRKAIKASVARAFSQTGLGT